MAFIKRSTTSHVDAKIGKSLRKCLMCGMPIVSKTSANLCHNCLPHINDDDNPEEQILDLDPDRD